jgi:hypothetical protein
MFDMKPARLDSYSQAINEQIEASIVETFNYVFGALAAELTSRQNTTFAFVTKLMLSIPGATVHTLRELAQRASMRVRSVFTFGSLTQPHKRISNISSSPGIIRKPRRSSYTPPPAST